MKIDRSHIGWIVFVTLATLGCLILYVANFHPHRLPFPIRLPRFLGESPPSRKTFGGTPLGLIFGSVAFLIFLFASALGIRKKKRLWPIGDVQFWLKAHIWLTVFTIPLVLFHCGFHFGGTQTTLLMVLYAVVMGSGFLGLALQQFLPRLMRERLSREVVFEQIPHLRGLLVDAARRLRENITRSKPALAASVPEPAATDPAELADADTRALLRFLDSDCLPYLTAKRGRRHPLGNEYSAAEIFRSLRTNVGGRWKPRIDEMQGWCNDRRMMDLQTRLQHWLHGWLLVHVPASVALLVFTAWHACIAVRFILIP